MSDFLYVTADKVGLPTGGGAVTFHESEALKGLGTCSILDRAVISTPGVFNEPWGWDDYVSVSLPSPVSNVKLAHFYAGTWGKTVDLLKKSGMKITHTAAAHDVALSKREHEKLGLRYDYPHLTDPTLLARYLRGYLQADVLVCPSRHSQQVVRAFGFTGRIEVIPHGVQFPGSITPLPSLFTVGYLGAVGPDKGLIYLLQAWKQLNYPGDEALLVVGGQYSRSLFVRSLIDAVYDGDVKYDHSAEQDTARTQGGRAKIVLRGWVNKVSDFYDNISLYVQPSVTEGFGIEVLEAMAHGRPVICSTGAGASDVVLHCDRFPPASPGEIASRVETAKKILDLEVWGKELRERAMRYTWDNVRSRYQKLWRELCP